MQLEDIVEKSDDGMRITADVGDELIIQIEETNIRFKSNLVGVERDAYLIVKTPSISGIGNKITAGDTVIVRYLSEGSVFGFESTIEGSIVRPARLVFIKYPKFVECKSIRRFKRISCNIPSTGEINGAEFKGMIVDISKGGCRFSCQLHRRNDASSIKIDDDVDLSLKVMDSSENLYVMGTIRNLIQDSAHLNMGIQFNLEDEDNMHKLDKFIENIMMYVE